MTLNSKIGIGAALIGAFMLGVTVVAYSSAQSETVQSKAPSSVETSFSDLEEEEIRELVRDYLLTNPEIIIEAVNVYSARERLRAASVAKESAAENLAALLDPNHGFVTGKNPKNAKVAVVELFDYHCGFCKRAAPLMKEIAERDGDVKVVFRELPILREESDYAAEMSLAAREQGKFLDLHFAMMGAKGVLTKERVHGLAEDAGINVNKLKKAREKAVVAEAITETHDIAAKMGVDGTPAFIVAAVDGSYVDIVTGFRPQELIQKIEEAKRAAQ